MTNNKFSLEDILASFKTDDRFTPSRQSFNTMMSSIRAGGVSTVPVYPHPTPSFWRWSWMVGATVPALVVAGLLLSQRTSLSDPSTNHVSSDTSTPSNTTSVADLPLAPAQKKEIASIQTIVHKSIATAPTPSNDQVINDINMLNTTTAFDTYAQDNF